MRMMCHRPIKEICDDSGSYDWMLSAWLPLAVMVPAHDTAYDTHMLLAGDAPDPS